MSFDLTRRTLMLGIGAAAASGGLMSAALAQAVAGASQPAPAAARPALPIPPELRADADGIIHLTAQAGTVDFGAGAPTATYGVNGAYLGSAIRVRRGDTVRMRVDNALPEGTTMHWHGLVIPGDQDGGPHNVVAPGGRWDVDMHIDQPAATLWYHPHIYPATAELVIKGLAGLLVVDDDDADALGLPSDWGVDDIPLVIQDRRFGDDAQFVHRFNLAAVTVGYVGDTLLVNGARQPMARTAKGWVRLRILNGSNARSYRLALSNGREFQVIGSDGGLLPAPVAMQDLTIHSGERYEIMIDARDGAPFDLETHPTDQPIMRLPPFDQPVVVASFDPSGPAGAGQLPDRLATLPDLPATPPPVSQTLRMDMNIDKQGMAALMQAGMMKVPADGPVPDDVARGLTDLIVNGPVLAPEVRRTANAVNGASFDLHGTPFGAAHATDLRWRIEEGDDKMPHPVHIHGCQFRILTIDGQPPAPHMAGFKDTVTIRNGGSAEVLLRFAHRADAGAPYMAHCHILEHEDSGMMAQFVVA